MEQFAELLSQLQATSSTTEKKEILSKADATCQEQLRYALDPFKMFNITSRNIDLNPGGSYTSWAQCRLLLDKLHERKLTGHAAADAVHDSLESATAEVQDAFLRIIDKDLKCGTGATLVNKVFKKLVPSFDVQLCQKYEALEKLPFKHTYCSRKLDGVRVLAMRSSVMEDFKFYSRKGNEFTTLKVLNKALKDGLPNYVGVIDGEVCIIENEKEDFTAVVSQIKRKSHTIKDPKYLIFDMLSLDEFASRTSTRDFTCRYLAMKQVAGNKHRNFGVLPQILLPTDKALKVWSNHSNKKGWEGLILRNGAAFYEGKRSKNLLKVKKFHEHEFEITGTQVGEGLFEGMLGAFLIKGEYEGKEITSKVGSGFKQTFEKSLANQPDHDRPDPSGERVRFWEKREELVGKIITVKFFEVCSDKTGDYSLRFPTFKCFHGKKRDI